MCSHPIPAPAGKGTAEQVRQLQRQNMAYRRHTHSKTAARSANCRNPKTLPPPQEKGKQPEKYAYWAA